MYTGLAPDRTSPANDDLCPLRAITSVSPGPATVMIATCTLSDEPFVEKRVCLAPTASAKSSCAADCTPQARSRVSTPWLSGRSKRAVSRPAHCVNSGAGPRPPLCAGMLKVSMPRSQKSRIASAIGAASCSLRTGPRRWSSDAFTLLSFFFTRRLAMAAEYCRPRARTCGRALRSPRAPGHPTAACRGGSGGRAHTRSAREPAPTIGFVARLGERTPLRRRGGAVHRDRHATAGDATRTVLRRDPIRIHVPMLSVALHYPRCGVHVPAG